MHGHLRFSPEEVDAVRVVSAVQTELALNEGTGSAGLFAIPFTLDPSIVISNTGALNPYRAISRIETIATKEWRGVSSDGVIAAYRTGSDRKHRCEPSAGSADDQGRARPGVHPVLS